ncbi:hypothetical protein ND436_002775 [Neisseria gonorrhoeae]|nr:hypothetical protein [Neisseria gonorrhoeae]UYP52466.1 hypothetical protein ND436_002775 [Neisseria gonorrhoeae]
MIRAADADKAAEKMRSSGDNAAKGFKAAIDSMHETMRNLHADVKAGFEAAAIRRNRRLKRLGRSG